MRNEKLVIVSAPSGAGKSTIVGNVLPQIPNLEFSVSATSRQARGEEVHGEHYYFLSADEFKKAIADEAFLEWEEVYADQFYGTLKSEVERLWDQGKAVIFDIDVIGGLNLKKMFGDKALAIFIQPPSEEALAVRLRGRGTDTEEKIQIRLAKARQELGKAEEFDQVVVNDNLEHACAQTKEVITSFLAN